MQKLKWLANPWVVLAAMLLGVIAGLLKLPFIFALEPLGNAYLSLLQMSVIPIMTSALTVSVYKLLKSKEALTYLKRTVLTFVIMLTAVTVLCLSVSFMFKGVVFNDAKSKDVIGELMLSNNKGTGQTQTNFIEIDSRRQEVSEQKQSVADMLLGMIPQNIFSALAKGDNLKLVFFFILVSIVATLLPDTRVLPLIKACEGIYDIFIKFVDILIYLLPLGIFSLTAVQFAKSGIAVILSMSKLLLVIYLMCAIIFFVCALILSRMTGLSLKKQFQAMYNTIMISIGTRNSFAAIPNAIQGLTEGLGISATAVNSVLPLGISLCRYGNIMVYAMGVVFVISLYNYQIGIDGLIMVLVGTVLTAMASSGAPGLVARSMISMILAPLGLPAQAIIVMLMAIDPLIDPFTTLLNVYPNCAATAIVAGSDMSLNIKLDHEGVSVCRS